MGWRVIGIGIGIGERDCIGMMAVSYCSMDKKEHTYIVPASSAAVLSILS